MWSMRSLLCALVTLLLAGATASAAQAVAPTIITSGPSGTTDQSTAVFEFSSEVGSTFTCALTSVEPLPVACDSPKTYSSLADGSYEFVVTATDPSGVPGPPATRTFTVETPPETTITAGPSGRTNSTSPAFRFTSSEAGSSFSCTLEGGAPNSDVSDPCGSPKSYSSLPDGAYVFTVKAKDPSGNVDPVGDARNFTIDTVAPGTTISDGPSGRTTSSSPRLSFTSSEAGSSFACTLEGGAPNSDVSDPCGSPKSYSSLPDGDYVFTVKARDPSGNVDPTGATRSFNVSTGIPPSPEPMPTPTPTPSGTQSSAATPTVSEDSKAPVFARPPVAPAPRVATKVDVTGPRIILSIRKRMSATKGGGVRFTLGSLSEATTGILSLRSSSRRGAVALGTLTFRGRPGRRAALRLILTPKARAALKRARRLDVRGTVILRDATGNASIKPFAFKLTAAA
jgi:hypothetical protein